MSIEMVAVCLLSRLTWMTYLDGMDDNIDGMDDMDDMDVIDVTIFAIEEMNYRGDELSCPKAQYKQQYTCLLFESSLWGGVDAVIWLL
jgi:hypothetical protein